MSGCYYVIPGNTHLLEARKKNRKNCSKMRDSQKEKKNKKKKVVVVSCLTLRLLSLIYSDVSIGDTQLGDSAVRGLVARGYLFLTHHVSIYIHIDCGALFLYFLSFCYLIPLP